MSTNALGYCEDIFNPLEPGRLCRGRERWIESELKEPHTLHRVVISGAVFSDESANDARRGLLFSGLSLGEVVAALYSRRKLHAWAEEASPTQVPDDASAVEPYTIGRPGGPLRRWAVRWTKPVIGAAAVEAVVAAGADVLVVPRRGAMDPDPVAPRLSDDDLELPPDFDDPERPPAQLGEGLRQRLYRLTGFRDGVQPGRRFQPGVLPELLQHVEAIILIHQDKHSPCIGIYSLTPMEPAKALEAACRKRGVLAVPFAIPPMLARWDRALWELRQEWDADTRGEFPVHLAPEGVHSWGRRHGRRRRSSSEEE
jgi:hypothetical protein